MTQELKDLDITIAQIEEIFFESMLAGYVSNTRVKIKKIPEMPGYKCIEFIKDNLRVVDAFCVRSGSNISHGFTTIWYNSVPIWIMHYGGKYLKKDIFFLKAVLRQTYEQIHFCGGRGAFLKNGINSFKGYQYINKVSKNSNFLEFSGIEYILYKGTQVGFHNYFGGLMI